MALVSVLTPVYNGARYLKTCIESVVSQTFKDWEYIIINNCSTDETLSIAKKYADMDSRIRIANNSRFVDIITNHNIAFSKANPQAKYCKMVQADDWIFPNCLENFVQLMEKYPSASLASAYRLDNDQLGLTGLPRSQTFFNGREIGRDILLRRIPEVFGSPSSHLFRADIIHEKQPFYNPDNIHSDTEACFYALSKGDLVFAHEMLTYTRRPGKSQTEKSNSLRSTYSGWLWILTRMGNHFLSDDDCKKVINNYLIDYYCVLARDLFTLRKGIDYWKFHTANLKKTGNPFSILKLISVIPKVVSKKIRKYNHLNPWHKM